MLAFLVTLLVIGLVAGSLARFVAPHTATVTQGNAVVLGIIGSFIGGLFGILVHGRGLHLDPLAIVGAVVGAALALWLYRSIGRHSTH